MIWVSSLSVALALAMALSGFLLYDWLQSSSYISLQSPFNARRFRFVKTFDAGLHWHYSIECRLIPLVGKWHQINGTKSGTEKTTLDMFLLLKANKGNRSVT